MTRQKIDPTGDTTYWDHAPCRCADWLIQAWEEVVYRSPRKDGPGFLSPEDIGEDIGLSGGMLRRFASKPSEVGETHRCARSAYISPVTKATGNPALVNAIAQHAGLKSTGPREPTDESPDVLLRKSLTEMAATLLEIAHSIPSGPIDTAKQQRLQYTMRRCREVFDCFDATVGDNVRHLPGRSA